jgi:hypothetical protein
VGSSQVVLLACPTVVEQVVLPAVLPADLLADQRVEMKGESQSVGMLVERRAVHQSVVRLAERQEY